MLDGSGVKAMPGLIPTPKSGSLKKNKKIQVAKWGKPKKYLYKKNYVLVYLTIYLLFYFCFDPPLFFYLNYISSIAN